MNLTPFDTNWKEGGGATPLTTQDLFFGDAISTPTAPTNLRKPLIVGGAVMWDPQGEHVGLQGKC